MRLVDCDFCGKKYYKEPRRLNEAIKFGWKSYWLYSRKIKHQVNYPYPENRKFTVDFKVGKKWIEFFGLSGQLKRYDELKLIKINLAKEYQLKLIKIYPDDLFPSNKLDMALGILLD